MGLIADIGEGPAALDTVAFIYWIEENRDYLRILAPLFQATEAGRVEIISSALTLLEVLVGSPTARDGSRSQSATRRCSRAVATCA